MSSGLLGTVLAGGQSSRFGSDKARATLDGRSLLDHAAARLASRVDVVLIAGRPHPTLAWTSDRPGPGLGPLGGLCGALAYAAAHGHRAVATVGCDMPLFDPELVSVLEGEGPAILADCPVVGFWPASLASELEAYLASGGDLAVRRWADRVGARRVPWPRALANVNTPADLRRLAEAVR